MHVICSLMIKTLQTVNPKKLLIGVCMMEHIHLRSSSMCLKDFNMLAITGLLVKKLLSLSYLISFVIVSICLGCVYVYLKSYLVLQCRRMYGCISLRISAGWKLEIAMGWILFIDFSTPYLYWWSVLQAERIQPNVVSSFLASLKAKILNVIVLWGTSRCPHLSTGNLAIFAIFTLLFYPCRYNSSHSICSSWKIIYKCFEYFNGYFIQWTLHWWKWFWMLFGERM